VKYTLFLFSRITCVTHLSIARVRLCDASQCLYFINCFSRFFVQRGRKLAQALLIELFVRFDFSVSVPNIFGFRFESVAESGDLAPDKSLEILKKIMKRASATDSKLDTAIGNYAAADYYAYRDSK